jgi:predicted ABC-type transport system involved in lysophospholipase L1 biosynthesis ATPase subunit
MVVDARRFRKEYMTSTADYRIRFENVSKRYGTHTVIDGLDLSIAAGEFVSLLGPSGSGKTTLLMMLAGFESVSDGAILLDGRRIENVPAYKRDMGVVFQNYALFPHMTAAENIAFPLKRRGASKATIQADVKRALDMVQLASLADRKPSQMSGGQQQRIALARALVFEPSTPTHANFSHRGDRQRGSRPFADAPPRLSRPGAGCDHPTRRGQIYPAYSQTFGRWSGPGIHQAASWNEPQSCGGAIVLRNCRCRRPSHASTCRHSERFDRGLERAAPHRARQAIQAA